MVTNIHYIVGNEELLDYVKELWEELNYIHLKKSPYFQRFYGHNTFEARKKSILSSAQNGQIFINLAYDGSLLIGYCISSIVDESGEVDSIFISADYRKKGIAGTLMGNALGWFEENNTKKLIIKVSVGNEEVFGFYAKYGFYPRLTELQMI